MHQCNGGNGTFGRKWTSTALELLLLIYFEVA